jgi:hypothetical protein
MGLPNEPLFTGGFARQATELPAQRMDPQIPAGRPRTVAEQADFDARVEAATTAKRIEMEQAEVEAAAVKRHEERVAQLEEERVANEKSQAELQAEADRRAALMAHPHTQLRGILNDLRAPTALDINGRVGALHQAVARLTQLVLQHTPPPNDEVTDGQRIDSGEQRQSFEGPDQQEPGGVRQQPEAWDGQRQQ